MFVCDSFWARKRALPLCGAQNISPSINCQGFVWKYMYFIDLLRDKAIDVKRVCNLPGRQHHQLLSI